MAKNYDKIEITEYAYKKLGVSDPQKLQAISSLYQDWYDNTQHCSVHINENAGPEEADIYFTIAMGGTKSGAENVYAILNKDNGVFTLRLQKIHNEYLQSLSSYDLATLIQSEGFGMSENGYNHGAYITSNSNSIYKDSAFIHLRDYMYRAELNTKKFLVHEIAKIAGHYSEDNSGLKSYSMYDDLYGYMCTHIKAVKRHKIRNGFKEFISHFDANALEILAKAKLPNAFYYSWLIGRGDCASFEKQPLASKESIKCRQDAARAFPVLLPQMVHDHNFTELIDSGKPMTEAIHSFLSKKATRDKEEPFIIKKEFIKWLAKQTPYLVDGVSCESNPSIYNVATDMRWLASIPREWRPRNFNEYRHYDRLFSCMRDYETLTGKTDVKLFQELLTSLNNPRSLPGYHEKDVGGENGSSVALSTLFKVAQPLQTMVIANQDKYESDFKLDGNCIHFIKRLGDQIILPELYAKLVESGISIEHVNQAENEWHACNPLDCRSKIGQLVKPIFENMTVVKIMSSSHRWHRHSSRLEYRTGYLSGDVKWHPIVSPIVTPNNVEISALSSTSELRDMATKMDNCVGGYSHQCALNRSHVLSLSDAEGAWTTNLELVETGDGKGVVKIAQHELPSNKSCVPDDAVTAANWLVDAINNKEIDVNWDAIRNSRQKHRKNQILVKVGFDPLSFDGREKAYEAWSKTMPNLFTCDNRLDFLSSTGILKGISEIVNKYYEEFGAMNTHQLPQRTML